MSEAELPPGGLDYPATQRNRDAIVDVLAPLLPETGRVLEVGSGSGQHVAYFAQRFPHLSFLPTEYEASLHSSIRAWAGDRSNIAEPRVLDASAERWFVEDEAIDIAAIVCCNVIHISPWATAVGLFAGARRILNPGSLLFTYGPYRRGAETEPSNLDFDRSLQQRNKEWGLRELDDVKGLAADQAFDLQRVVKMPANNLSLIFRRRTN